MLDCLVPHEDESHDFQSRKYQELNLNSGVLVRFDCCHVQPILDPGKKDYSELVRLKLAVLRDISASMPTKVRLHLYNSMEA
jgi:hypothetical protein